MLTDKTCLSVQFLQIGPVKKNVQIRAIFFRQKFNSSPKTLIYNITSKASYIFELEWTIKKSWLNLVSHVGKLHFWGFFSERTKKKNAKTGKEFGTEGKKHSIAIFKREHRIALLHLCIFSISDFSKMFGNSYHPRNGLVILTTLDRVW